MCSNLLIVTDDRRKMSENGQGLRRLTGLNTSENNQAEFKQARYLYWQRL